MALTAGQVILLIVIILVVIYFSMKNTEGMGVSDVSGPTSDETSQANEYTNDNDNSLNSNTTSDTSGTGKPNSYSPQLSQYSTLSHNDPPSQTQIKEALDKMGGKKGNGYVNVSYSNGDRKGMSDGLDKFFEQGDPLGLN